MSYMIPKRIADKLGFGLMQKLNGGAEMRVRVWDNDGKPLSDSAAPATQFAALVAGYRECVDDLKDWGDLAISSDYSTPADREQLAEDIKRHGAVLGSHMTPLDPDLLALGIEGHRALHPAATTEVVRHLVCTILGLPVTGDRDPAHEE